MKAWPLSFLVLTTAIHAQTAPVIGIWEFDETSGLVANDSSPNGNHGALRNFTNDPLQWVPGVFGNALAFDGTDDYVELPTGNGLPTYQGFGESFSICMWINGQPTDDDRVLTFGSSTNNTPLFTFGTGSATRGQADRLRLYNRNAENFAMERLSDASVFDGTWHHIAYVETSGSARLYVDGRLDTGNVDGRFGACGTRSASFGTFPLDVTSFGNVIRPSLCCFYQGLLDSVQIYGCEITEAEVQAIFGGGTAAFCAASMGEYGAGCGAGPLEIFALGSPMLGGPGLQFFMRGGSPNAAASLCLGTGTIVPLDLATVGLPGCTLYVPTNTCLNVGLLTSTGGSASPFPIPVPNAPAFVGLRVNFQALALSIATGAQLSQAIVTNLNF